MKTSISIMGIMLIMLMSVPASAMTSEVYRFQVVPGTGEWKDLGSTRARVEALQIPTGVLENMSTKTLVRACLDFPFLAELWYAAESRQEALNRLVEVFNGLRELLNRKDAAAELLKVYSQLAPGHVQADWSQYEKGKYSFRLAAVELLLAQQPVLENLQKDRILLKKAASYLESKKKRRDLFGNKTLMATALLMGRVMRTDKVHNKVFRQKASEITELDEFLKHGHTPHVKAVIDEITAEAQQVLLYNE